MDLSQYTTKELKEISAQIDSQMKIVEAQAKRDAFAKIKQIADENGVDLRQLALLGARNGGRSHKKGGGSKKPATPAVTVDSSPAPAASGMH